MPDRKTAVEVDRDGTRRVYHHHVQEPGVSGPSFAWTHPDTKDDRAACSMCTSGTLDSVRNAPR